MAENNKNQQAGAQEEGQGTNFTIQRIYLKDASFESPKAPNIFLEKWEPEINVNLHTTSQKLEDEVHEVGLKVTVTAKQNEETVFIVEVEQGGIFSIGGKLSKDELQHILGSFCPSLLFPYARETITNFVSRGGFPNFYLAPINFDQVYQQYLQQQAEESQKASE